MGVIGKAALRLVTLLVFLALLVACSGPGRANPTPTPGEEPPPSEMPAGEPSPDNPDQPTVTEVPPEIPTDIPTAPPAASATDVPPTTAPTVPPTLPPTTAPTAPPTPSPASTSPLATYRLVTYYGHPAEAKMGILGESDPATMVQKLKQQAAAFTAADPSRPALCTIELIASVAQGSPGPEGLWLLRTQPKVIDQYAQLAEQNGCLLMLDIQMGLDSVANDVQAILPYLKRPYVHLAIDPEFHVKPGQVPGETFGSISAADVMATAQLLGNLVRENNIPDKVLVLHQFRSAMLPDKENIKPVPNVDMVVVMDGWGTPASKINNYQAFIHDELIQYGGLKLFYRQDDPLMTPQEVLQLDPLPMVIIFQ